MTIASIVLRRILRSRRTWALLILSLIAVAISASAASANDPARVLGNFLRAMFIPIVLGLVSLVISTSAIGDEREDLTILYVAQTPLARARIVFETWLASVAAAAIVVLPALFAAVFLARSADQPSSFVLDLLLGTVLAICAYCAVGVLLGLLTKRAALVGAAYILVWEGSLSGFAAGARNLSIAQHTRSFVGRVADPVVRDGLNPPAIAAGTALVALLIAAVGGIALAGRRLRRMNLP